MRYAAYFPEYTQYFGRALKLLESMYGMTNSSKLFADELTKWFVDTVGKRFHVNFLGFAHWFMSMRIYQLKDHSISVDQARYATSIVAKYFDTGTVKVSNTLYKKTLTSDMIFSK